MNRTTTRTLPAVLALLLAACGPKNTFVEPPPPGVTVVTVQPEDITTYEEFPGKTEAVQSVEIRARVTGFLRSVDFEPGVAVKKGQLLFTIEPEQFEAAVAVAKGNLAKATADYDIAKANRMRREQALKTKAVAELDVLKAKADEDAAAATIQVAEANLTDAEINLSYTKIVSPIEGITSRNMVTIGNLVGGSDATLLTTVVDDDPLYAYFELSERQILPFLNRRKDLADTGRMKRGEVPVKLKLANGTLYGTEGRLDFLDNRLDPETGTMRARAVFANPNAEVAEGLYVAIMIPDEVKGAILVPREAIQRDLAGRFVLTVDKDNVVVRQIVEPGAVVGYRQIVTGLEAGQRVIVRGLQRAREGIDVTPEEATPATDPGTPATPDDQAAPPDGAEARDTNIEE
jgi:RND family efflux transporter MFP subunit